MHIIIGREDPPVVHRLPNRPVHGVLHNVSEEGERNEGEGGRGEEGRAERGEGGQREGRGRAEGGQMEGEGREVDTQ